MGTPNNERQAKWRERRQQMIDKLTTENAALKARNDVDGSLFDWNNDTVRDIAAAMLGSNKRKAESLAKEILGTRRPRKTQKPAG